MHTELLSQPWIERRIGRGDEALVVTGEHCSRGVKYTEDFRVVSRVSFFNILFSRIRLIVISFRFVTVTMHGEERNLGSVFVSGQPSSSQVSRAPIPIRVRDPIALEMSSSMNWTSSSTIIQLDIRFTVPRRE